MARPAKNQIPFHFINRLWKKIEEIYPYKKEIGIQKKAYWVLLQNYFDVPYTVFRDDFSIVRKKGISPELVSINITHVFQICEKIDLEGLKEDIKQYFGKRNNSIQNYFGAYFLFRNDLLANEYNDVDTENPIIVELNEDNTLLKSNDIEYEEIHTKHTFYQYLHVSFSKEDTVYFILNIGDKNREVNFISGLSLGHNAKQESVAAPILLVKRKIKLERKEIDRIVQKFFKPFLGQKMLKGISPALIERWINNESLPTSRISDLIGNWWVYTWADNREDSLLKCCLNIDFDGHLFTSMLKSPDNFYDTGTIDIDIDNVTINLKHQYIEVRIIGYVGKTNSLINVDEINAIYITTGRKTPLCSNLVMLREKEKDFEKMKKELCYLSSDSHELQVLKKEGRLLNISKDYIFLKK